MLLSRHGLSEIRHSHRGTEQFVKDRSVILVESGGPSMHKFLRLFAAPLVLAQAMVFLRTEHFDHDLTYRELARRPTAE
jgi:hypothetical protein